MKSRLRFTFMRAAARITSSLTRARDPHSKKGRRADTPFQFA
jgi:hypothetical protein